MSDDEKSEEEDRPVEKAEPKATQALAYTPSYVFLVVVTVVNLVADLWSKAWAKNHFESLRPGDPRRYVIIEDYVQLIFAKNRGGAWGLLQNETESLRRPFFLIVSVAAIVFIVSLYRKLQPGQHALKWGLPLVLGGALGNLVDRVRYGYVVDFIDVFAPDNGSTWRSFMELLSRSGHWPTFNVADISICVGVGLMAIDMFTTREQPDPKKAKDGETDKKEPPASEEPAAVPPAVPPAAAAKADDGVEDAAAEEAAGEGA